MGYRLYIYIYIYKNSKACITKKTILFCKGEMKNCFILTSLVALCG